jgi:hypothetical protein
MYRPVRNFADLSTNSLRAEIAASGIADNRIQILGSPTSRTIILGSGDLNRLFEYAEIDPGAVDIDGLSEYLETHMPGSCDDDLRVPSYPFGEYVPLNRNPTTSNVRLFTLGTDNPNIRLERSMAQTLTEEFLGVDQEDASEAWLPWDYMTEAWLAKTYGPQATEAFRTLLNKKPWLVPREIILGRTAIEDGRSSD